MIKKEVTKGFLLVFAILFLSSAVSAGIGIKWDKESALVEEGGRACLTYGVYNPWPSESYVTIGLDGDLNQVLVMQEADSKLIPAETSSNESIPLEFCFKVPHVYERDCSVGSFICELACPDELQTYDGNVVISSIPNPLQVTDGAGSSSTVMSVSAPLRIRVSCESHPRDYTLAYIIVAIISALVIFWILFSKYRKPKAQRDAEKLKKLRAEIASERKKSLRKKK